MLNGEGRFMDLKKLRQRQKHHNKNIMTIVALGFNINFYWLPKVTGYAGDFTSFFKISSY